MILLRQKTPSQRQALEGTDILQVGRLRRAAEEAAELGNRARIGGHCVADDRLRTVMSLIMRQRNGPISATRFSRLGVG
jgi:hypothetical protein